MEAYLKKVKRKGPGKYSWHLNPPEDLLKAGIAKRQIYRDGRIAKAAHKALLQKVKDYRAGKLVGKSVPENASLLQLAAHYLQSSHFNSLSKNTQDAYRGNIKFILSTPYRGRTLGDMKVAKLTSKICSEVYELWLKNNSPVAANTRKKVFGVLMSYAMLMDLRPNNPMQPVKGAPENPQVSIWTRQQVTQFLDVAFGDFKYRSVGIIVLLCYEWGQRPVDIAYLTWDCVDFDEKVCTITQRKTKAVVYLPIEGNVLSVLQKQHEDYSFQKYVCPQLGADKAWKPLNSSRMSLIVNEVKELAGLPKDLQLRGLRSTAITEMVEANVEVTQIKQVTGHKSLASLNPYVKNTLKGASSALSLRKGNQQND